MNFNLLFTRTEISSNDNNLTESKLYIIEPNDKYKTKKGTPRKTKENRKTHTHTPDGENISKH